MLGSSRSHFALVGVERLLNKILGEFEISPCTHFEICGSSTVGRTALLSFELCAPVLSAGQHILLIQ